MIKILTIIFALLISTSILADFEKGKNAYNSGDYRTALKELLPYANEGDARAQWALGSMYRWGYGVLKDYSEARKWFEKSGNQGISRSSAQLASMYWWGEGVDNANISTKWWKKAAEQGDIIAMYKVGLIYAKGFDVPQNKSEAKKWFKLAYSQASSDLKQSSKAGKTLLEDIKKANDSMERGYFDKPISVKYYFGEGMGWY